MPLDPKSQIGRGEPDQFRLDEGWQAVAFMRCPGTAPSLVHDRSASLYPV
jgi:hypothetical protein